MDSEPVVEIVAGSIRARVHRDIGMAVFARAVLLTDQRRVEPVEVPLAGPKPTVLHLLLGADAIALIDPADPLADSDAMEGLAPAESRSEPIPGSTIVPDFDAYAPTSER